MRLAMNICKLLIMGILPVLCACEHKELCYHHPHTVTVMVEFDWQNAPAASPEGMCVFFYPQDADGSVERYDFLGTTGGEVKLPAGMYNVICYNNDTEGVSFSGTSKYDTYTAYTRDDNSVSSSSMNAGAKSNAEGDDYDDSGERAVINPDMMWSASAYNLEITEEGGISYVCVPQEDGEDVYTESPDNVLMLYPKQIVCSYTFQVLNVQNLKYAVQISGTLSGMSAQINIPTSELGTECVRIPFDGKGDGEQGITGGFYTFGHNESNTEPHYMIFCVEITDGSKHYYTYNVTDQVNDAPDRKNVHIIIDGMELPIAISNGDGFDPSVDDWQGEDLDIPM